MTNSLENAREASEQELDEQEKNSVYDFLYHDVRRVGSFLAQFDDAGHLQGVTQSETVAKGRKRGWRFSLGGGVPEAGTGEVAFERAPAEAGSETSERAYDPLWTNARTLLDFLFERGLIQRDIHAAQIGDFVLVSGSLLFFDVAMFKNAWNAPAIRKVITSGAKSQSNRHERRKEATKPTPAVDNDAQIAMELLSLFPHSLQAQVVDDTFKVWLSLQESSLVGLSGDLVLKHGTFVAGKWHLLGILDAQPGLDPEPIDGVWQLTEVEKAIVGLAGTLVPTLVAKLAPMARRLLGRPSSAFGVTPLLIFRQIGEKGQTGI